MSRRARRPARRAAGAAVLLATVAMVAVASLAACGGTGARTSTKVPGFDETAFRVRSPGSRGTLGPVHCALLARTAAQQAQGLMNRQDLAGHAGMLFQWTSPTTDEFYMKDTLIPLSIAWFNGSGQFVSSTDMTPCPPGTTCPLYAAAAPYTLALEVPQGGLPALGIGPGSSVALAGSCH